MYVMSVCMYCIYISTQLGVYGHIHPLPSEVPLGTPSDEGLYLTVHAWSRPNTDTVRCSAVQISFLAVLRFWLPGDPGWVGIPGQ